MRAAACISFAQHRDPKSMRALCGQAQKSAEVSLEHINVYQILIIVHDDARSFDFLVFCALKVPCGIRIRLGFLCRCEKQTQSMGAPATYSILR